MTNICRATAVQNIQNKVEVKIINFKLDLENGGEAAKDDAETQTDQHWA